MKTEQTLENDCEVDEFDDYQYELTTELAHDFIDETVMPMLEDFDFNNPSEDYVPGVATFGLFIRVVGSLLLEGFTTEQLKEVIDDFSVESINDTVH